METLNITIEESVAIQLAISRGWEPTIADPEYEGEDEAPQIDNPIAYKDFVTPLVEQTLKEEVLTAGRKIILDWINSNSNTLAAQIDLGAFDALILAGQIDTIKTAIKNHLQTIG